MMLLIYRERDVQGGLRSWRRELISTKQRYESLRRGEVGIIRFFRGGSTCRLKDEGRSAAGSRRMVYDILKGLGGQALDTSDNEKEACGPTKNLARGEARER